LFIFSCSNHWKIPIQQPESKENEQRMKQMMTAATEKSLEAYGFSAEQVERIVQEIYNCVLAHSGNRVLPKWAKPQNQGKKKRKNI
jgi:hypothetical protein